tara:strand:+ start:18013 stop:18348 length:336 start_codon:yes stop_codon:yes gene_type:complete
MQNKITIMLIVLFTAFLLVSSSHYVETANSMEQSEAIINQLLVSTTIERMVEEEVDTFVGDYLDYAYIVDDRDYPEADMEIYDSQDLQIGIVYITEDLEIVVEDMEGVISY